MLCKSNHVIKISITRHSQSSKNIFTSLLLVYMKIHNIANVLRERVRMAHIYGERVFNYFSKMVLWKIILLHMIEFVSKIIFLFIINEIKIFLKKSNAEDKQIKKIFFFCIVKYFCNFYFKHFFLSLTVSTIFVSKEKNRFSFKGCFIPCMGTVKKNTCHLFMSGK